MTELEKIRLKNWYDKCSYEYGDNTENMEIHILQDYVDTQGDVAGQYIKEVETFLMFVKIIYKPMKSGYMVALSNGYKGKFSTYFDFLIYTWNVWDEKYKMNWLLEHK
jgi:hypothetical protein